MRHLRGRSERLTPARARGGAILLLLAVVLLCWGLGGGEFAAERWLMVEGERVGLPLASPLLVVTRLGNLPVLGPIALLLAMELARRRGLVAALAFLGTLALFRILLVFVKHGVARPRPALGPHLDRFASGFSFPSAHASDTMAVFLGFALAWGGRRLACAAAGLSLVVGLTRVALGVHWPSDVLAGWCFGTLGAMAAASISRAAERSR